MNRLSCWFIFGKDILDTFVIAETTVLFYNWSSPELTALRWDVIIKIIKWCYWLVKKTVQLNKHNKPQHWITGIVCQDYLRISFHVFSSFSFHSLWFNYDKFQLSGLKCAALVIYFSIHLGLCNIFFTCLSLSSVDWWKMDVALTCFWGMKSRFWTDFPGVQLQQHP